MMAAVDFLLKRKSPLSVFPLIRIVTESAEAGYAVGTTLGTISSERIERTGGATGPTDLYTPSIEKYEASALGSTRII